MSRRVLCPRMPLYIPFSSRGNDALMEYKIWLGQETVKMYVNVCVYLWMCFQSNDVIIYIHK